MIQHFSRAIKMFNAIAAIQANSALSFQEQQAYINSLGSYHSRGKGGKRAQTFSGVARARRQAKKARNKS